MTAWSDSRLTGFLSGSIDAVFRIGTPGAQRYLVADYKTNWVGGSMSDRLLNAQDYGPTAMAEAMMSPLPTTGAAVSGRAASVPALAGT